MPHNVNTALQDQLTPISTMQPWPGNPRQGDIDVIAKSLEVNSQFKPIVIQDSTGYICAGNHTWHAAQQLGWDQIAAVRLNLTDVQAKRILVVDNQAAQVGGGFNEYLLAEVLKELADTDIGLDGTGYQDDWLDDLLVRLEPDEDAMGRETDPGPTDAQWAEEPDAREAREARVAGERSLAVQGLAEVVVILPVDDKAALMNGLEAMREHLGEQPTGPLVHAAVRIAVAVLDGAKTNAPPVQWQDMLREAGVEAITW